MLLRIQILHILGSMDSIFPKAFENNNMHFFLEKGGGGGWWWAGGLQNRVCCGRFQSSHSKL